DLVDEDDGGRDLARLREELADAAGPDADDHLDELGGAGAEEGDVGLARGGTREKGLAGPGGAGQEDALGRSGTQEPVLLRVAQEVHHLADLGLDLVDARDVIERDSNGLRID